MIFNIHMVAYELLLWGIYAAGYADHMPASNLMQLIVICSAKKTDCQSLSDCRRGVIIGGIGECREINPKISSIDPIGLHFLVDWNLPLCYCWTKVSQPLQLHRSLLLFQ